MRVVYHRKEYERMSNPTIFEDQIDSVLDFIKNLLLGRNKAYGNSALDPIRIFSDSDTNEQILVRIDDKLSRIKNTSFTNLTQDTLDDLIGYLVLLKINLNSPD